MASRAHSLEKSTTSPTLGTPPEQGKTLRKPIQGVGKKGGKLEKRLAKKVWGCGWGGGVQQ